MSYTDAMSELLKRFGGSLPLVGPLVDAVTGANTAQFPDTRGYIESLRGEINRGDPSNAEAFGRAVRGVTALPIAVGSDVVSGTGQSLNRLGIGDFVRGLAGVSSAPPVVAEDVPPGVAVKPPTPAELYMQRLRSGQDSRGAISDASGSSSIDQIIAEAKGEAEQLKQAGADYAERQRGAAERFNAPVSHDWRSVLADVEKKYPDKKFDDYSRMTPYLVAIARAGKSEQFMDAMKTAQQSDQNRGQQEMELNKMQNAKRMQEMGFSEKEIEQINKINDFSNMKEKFLAETYNPQTHAQALAAKLGITAAGMQAKGAENAARISARATAMHSPQAVQEWELSQIDAAVKRGEVTPADGLAARLAVITKRAPMKEYVPNEKVIEPLRGQADKLIAKLPKDAQDRYKNNFESLLVRVPPDQAFAALQESMQREYGAKK